MKTYFVYILASKRNGTIYVGMANNLIRRVYEHRNYLVKGFTSRHHVIRLVYYEIFYNPESALLREKAIKSWRRSWKVELIERSNPNWEELYFSIIGN